VDFVLFEPRPPVPQDIYLENEINVTVQGGYHEIGMFLGRLSNLPRIVNVKQINMKNVPDPSSKDAPELVEANMGLAAYMLMPEGQRGPAQQPPTAVASAGAKGGNRGGH
jgi:Tfp pilus assembly protein PilO